MCEVNVSCANCASCASLTPQLFCHGGIWSGVIGTIRENGMGRNGKDRKGKTKYCS